MSRAPSRRVRFAFRLAMLSLASGSVVASGSVFAGRSVFAGDGGLGPDLPPGPLPKPSPSPPPPRPAPSTSPSPALPVPLPNQSPQTVTRGPGVTPAPLPSSITTNVKDVLKPRRLPAWLALEEEDAPEPPIVKAELGVIAWPYLRTSFQFGRRGGALGSDLDDVESSLHLPRQGISPWGEISLGNELRAGGNCLLIDRSSYFHQTEVPLNFRGIQVANAGDFTRVDFRLTQAEGFVAWDVLYGARYRIGPIGGALYTRIATRITGVGVEGRQIVYRSASPVNDLFSPFFGGHVELDPVELFTVYADVRVVDWAWAAIGLQNQRTFSSRLGLSLTLLDGLVGVALDFRFLSTSIDTSSTGGRNHSQYQLDGVGIGLQASFRY